MKILFFASLREKVGHGEEDAAVPSDVATPAALIEWLKGRGENYASAFGDLRAVRVAVNQEHVKLDHALRDGDEVAFFPPVTGG